MRKAPEYFVEQRRDGRYSVLKPNATRPSAIVQTQAEGIERARQLNPGAAIHVERVRSVGDGRDKWRKV